MQSKAKSNSVCTSVVRDGNIVITVNGAAGPELILYPSRVSTACREQAMLRGLNQSAINKAAIERDKETGRPATPQTKYDAVADRVEYLNSGAEPWSSATRAARAPGFDGGLVIMAMIRAGLAADVDAANGMVDKLATKREIERNAALKTWAETKEVAKAIMAIKIERLPLSAAGLVAELEGD